MALLRRGERLSSNVTLKQYNIVSSCVAEGGFGEVYRGREVGERGARADVAIKVSLDSVSWHGEAYFGRLLEGQRHVVALRDAFPLIRGSGKERVVKYVLVFEWMSEGTVDDELQRENAAWPEKSTMRQISNLLRVLQLLHRRGICHGDITPRNVFVRAGSLFLGDLGIAKQTLSDGPITMDAAAPEAFQPHDVNPFRWSPSNDVYQVGLLTLSLLTGRIVSTPEVAAKLLRKLPASDATKGWARDALIRASQRFQDAQEALVSLSGGPVKRVLPPRTLRGQRIVFTGTLPMDRPKAAALARRAGALVQGEVTGTTTLVVRGKPNPLQIGQEYGKKLYDAHRRIRRGQRIAIIDARGFSALLGGLIK
jgi:serine/threonine protein kinase